VARLGIGVWQSTPWFSTVLFILVHPFFSSFVLHTTTTVLHMGTGDQPCR
jgi:hypothetical protein